MSLPVKLALGYLFAFVICVCPLAGLCVKQLVWQLMSQLKRWMKLPVMLALRPPTAFVP